MLVGQEYRSVDHLNVDLHYGLAGLPTINMNGIAMQFIHTVYHLINSLGISDIKPRGHVKDGGYITYQLSFGASEGVSKLPELEAERTFGLSWSNIVPAGHGCLNLMALGMTSEGSPRRTGG